jgi:hypothetical protein
MTVKIKFVDILRATLGFRTGNESWIGVSPDSNRYHIVSPVDTQISKGVMACNRPTDGTPFGGYRGWVYLRIPPFFDELQDAEVARRDHALKVSQELIRKLDRYGIRSSVEWEDHHPKEIKTEPNTALVEQNLFCSSCDKTWKKLIDCVKDLDLIFLAYHPCVSDFVEGSYVFQHICNGLVYIPVSRFVRRSNEGKNLANLNACPGYCHYKDSIQECCASCEGSPYRRLARRLYEKVSDQRKKFNHNIRD